MMKGEKVGHNGPIIYEVTATVPLGDSTRAVCVDVYVKGWKVLALECAEH